MLLFTVDPENWDIVPGFRVHLNDGPRPYVKMGNCYNLPLSDELVLGARLTSTMRLLHADLETGGKLQLIAAEQQDSSSAALVIMGTDNPEKYKPTCADIVTRVIRSDRCFAPIKESFILARVGIGQTIGFEKTTRELVPPTTLRQRLGFGKTYVTKAEYIRVAAFDGKNLSRV